MEQIFWDNFKNTDKLLILDYVGRLPLIYQKALQDCYGEDYNELLKKGVKLTDAKKAIKKINYLINNPNYYVRATNYNPAKNLNGEIKVFSGKQKKVYLKEKLNCDENTIKRISIIFRLNPEFKILYKYFGINLDESIDEFELSREDYETLKKIYKSLSDFINSKSLLVRNVLGLTYSEFAFCFEKELTTNPKLKKIKKLCKKNIITEPINLLDIDDKTFLNIIKCIYCLKPNILMNQILANNKFNITLQEFLDANEKEMDFILEKNKNTDVGNILKNLWQDDYTKLCIDKNNDSINELVTILNVLINDLFSYRYLIKVKTLQEILEATEEEIEYIKKFYHQKTKGYQILIKVFGENLDKDNSLYYCLSVKEKDLYHYTLNYLKSFLKKDVKTSKTLKEILEITEEEMEYIKKYYLHTTKGYQILVKVFGENLDKDDSLYSSLPTNEKNLYRQAIISLKNFLKKATKTGKTLKEILEATEEEMEYIKKYYSHTTKGYQILVKVFGESLDKDDSLYSNLSKEEKDLYRQTINSLKSYLEKATKTSKTLQEILKATEEEIEYIKKYYSHTTKGYQILVKVFGESLDKDDALFSSLSSFEKDLYRHTLKSLNKFLKKEIKKYKTLRELLDATEEEMEFLKQKYPKHTKNYLILIKVFGDDFESSNCNFNALDSNEKKIYANAIRSIKNFLETYRKKLIKKGKTLTEILNISSEEVEYIKKNYPISTKNYAILVKIFGTDLKDTNEKLNYLTNDERKNYYDALNSLKGFIKKRVKKSENETLQEILDATEEEIEFLNKRISKKTKTYERISKVFGTDFKGTKEPYYNLALSEKRNFSQALIILKKHLKKYREINQLGFKTLEEILDATEEEIEYLKDNINKDSKSYKAIVKVFGENFKENNQKVLLLNAEEKRAYSNGIQLLKSKLKVHRKNKNLTYKTLQKILEATEEEIEYLKDNLSKETSTYKLISEVFGNDFKGTNELLYRMHGEDRRKYYKEIYVLKIKLKAYRNDLANNYKTLQEILGATDEEMNYLSKIYPQNTRSYQFLVSMFGIDFRNIGNLSKLSSEANMLLNDTIAILQTYLCMQRENTKDGNLQQIETEGPVEILTSKEYITVETPFKHPFFKEFLMLLPIEYQYITALRLGLIYDGKIHSIEELAEIFNIDIETARKRCSKGINIFILIIEKYKELYNQNIPNIDALIENIKLVL